jgi:hypothetical protein
MPHASATSPRSCFVKVVVPVDAAVAVNDIVKANDNGLDAAPSINLWLDFCRAVLNRRS